MKKKKFQDRGKDNSSRKGKQPFIEPGTIQRQEALVSANTAGKFFKVTNGGGPMNSDDCIIAAGINEKEKISLFL